MFDVRTQGYDGVLNGGGAYESGAEGKVFLPRHFRVVVGFAYNTELTELRELASVARISAPDLFDWITITGTAADGDENIVLDYECG